MKTRLIDYITFLYNSGNEHSVHSPFVFKLVTQCFYNKNYYPSYEKIIKNTLLNIKVKEQKLLLRLIEFLNIKYGTTFCKTHQIDSFLDFHIQENTSFFDCIFIDSTDEIQTIQLAILRLKKGGLLIINRPYHCKEKRFFWKKIISDENFSVTIDTFTLAFAFIRPEQRKQHFTIRT